MTIYSYAIFEKCLIKDWSPTLKPVYNILDPNGLKLLTRLRLGLSHLNEHKFNHNFKECVNIHYAPVVCRLSLFPTFFCTAITSQILDAPGLQDNWENIAYT